MRFCDINFGSLQFLTYGPQKCARGFPVCTVSFHITPRLIRLASLESYIKYSENIKLCIAKGRLEECLLGQL